MCCKIKEYYCNAKKYETKLILNYFYLSKLKCLIFLLTIVYCITQKKVTSTKLSTIDGENKVLEKNKSYTAKTKKYREKLTHKSCSE